MRFEENENISSTDIETEARDFIQKLDEVLAEIGLTKVKCHPKLVGELINDGVIKKGDTVFAIAHN